MQKNFLYRLFVYFIFLFASCEVEATFGYLDYSTYNSGDDIQSLAAQRFLPKNAIPLDREFIHSFESDEIVPLKSWPPSSSINPLLITFRLSAFLPEAFSEEGLYGPAFAPFLQKLSSSFLAEGLNVKVFKVTVLYFKKA